MDLKSYISNIESHIIKSDLEQALRFYKDLGDVFGINSVQEMAILLLSEYNEKLKNYSKGLLTQDDFGILKQRINQRLLTSLNELKGNVPPVTISSITEKGRIIHNIPNRMSKDVEIYCSVRIAKDDLKLLEGFTKAEGDEPEDVEISGTMEVNLVDPTGNKVFQIRRITEDAIEQPITDHTYTEWDFAINPLQEGKHFLILYVYIIEVVRDKEVKRQLKLKKDIEINAYNEHYYQENQTSWELTNMTVPGMKRNKFRFLFFSFGVLNARNILIALFASLGLGYLIYRVFSTVNIPIQPAPAEVNVKPVLILNQVLKVDTVKINGVPNYTWSANTDTTEIYLPEQKPGNYYVSVKGENGECGRLIKLTKDSFQFVLSCTIKKLSPPPQEQTPPKVPPTPPTPVFDVQIITPFRAPIVKIDGAEKPPAKSTFPEGKLFITVYRTKGGHHKFEVHDRNNQFDCSTLVKTENINVAKRLEFNCTRIPKPNPTYQVKVRLVDGAKYLPEDVWVVLDGQKINVKGVIDKVNVKIGFFKTIRKDLVFTIENVSKQSHNFSVTKTCDSAPCPSKAVVVDSSQTIEYICDFTCLQ